MEGGVVEEHNIMTNHGDDVFEAEEYQKKMEMWRRNVNKMGSY